MGAAGSRGDSPGPEKTKNPWESEGASRRSSISAKPEVLVTGSEEQGKGANGEAGKTSMPRLMSLLPAPTPSRFIGKMHAVVAKGDKKGTIDTITENADENEIREGDGGEAKEMSKGTKSLRQKAKILGRFRGFSKQGSGDQGSEDGSGISDGTAKSAQKNQLASPP